MGKVTLESVDGEDVISLRNTEERRVYSSPKHEVIGNVGDITKANGTGPKMDSETTIGSLLS